jgi:hypothetical protein
MAAIAGFKGPRGADIIQTLRTGLSAGFRRNGRLSNGRVSCCPSSFRQLDINMLVDE